MIKRFNPDFSLSISHELAYMRETPEGGYVAHGDYATLFSELEVVKAERDALADKCGRRDYNLGNALVGEQEAIRRADALAVENAEMRSVIDAAVEVSDNSAGIAGWHLNGEIAGWDEILPELNIETPATSAALAAIEERVWAEAKDLAKSMLATDSADHIDFLFDGKIKQLREVK